MRKFEGFLKKMAFIAYRVFAAVALYGILFGVGGYGFMLAFYVVNTSWTAPFIVRPTNDKILDLTSKIVTSQQVLASLKIDRDRWADSLGEMKSQKASLQRLDADLKAALGREDDQNKLDGPELVGLDRVKKSDNKRTGEILEGISTLEKEIDQDLKAGLITKGDAAAQKAALNQSRTSATDSRISELLLHDAVLQKNTRGSTLVESLTRKAEIESEIAQLEIQIVSGEQQQSTDNAQIASLEEAVNTVHNSPYFLATKNEAKFSFVPYANQAAVRVGAPIYACYLNMVLCRKAGEVKQVFGDEMTATHPVYKTEVRGFLVQLEMTDKEAAKSAVLFIDRKPLYF